jgi:hypothetical protein
VCSPTPYRNLREQTETLLFAASTSSLFDRVAVPWAHQTLANLFTGLDSFTGVIVADPCAGLRISAGQLV